MGLIKTGIVSRKGFGGGTKLYAIGLHYDNIKDEELVQYMKQNLQIGVASAVAAVHAFRKVVTTFLLNGHTIVEFLQKLVDGIYNVRVRYTPTPKVTVAAKSA